MAAGSCILVVEDDSVNRRAIRNEEPEGEHIPVVALTANALSGEPRRAAEAGVDGYLTKPLQLSALIYALGQHLVQGDGNKVTIAANPAVQPEADSNEVIVFDPDVLQRLLGDNV